MAGGSRFLDHRGVLLRHLIHLVDGGVDFGKADRLLARRGGDCVHVVIDLRDILADRAERLAGVPHLLHAALHFLAGVTDQVLDFLGRIGGTLRQFANLLRHDGKTTPGLARTCRFHTGIQRQKIGLEGDFIDDRDDLADAL